MNLLCIIRVHRWTEVRDAENNLRRSCARCHRHEIWCPPWISIRGEWIEDMWQYVPVPRGLSGVLDDSKEQP